MGNIRNDTIPNMACPFPPRTWLNHSLLEQGIKKEARLGKINVETIPCPDNWFTPSNIPDNETVFALLSLAGGHHFLSNALSLITRFKPIFWKLILKITQFGRHFPSINYLKKNMGV